MLDSLGLLGIVLEYLGVFIIVFLLNYFFFIRKKKTYNKNEVPVELAYLVNLYKINIKKINYRNFVWIYSMTNTFIITTIYIIVANLIDKFIFQLIVGLVLLILMIVICYGIIGRIYEKRGEKKCTTSKK